MPALLYSISEPGPNVPEDEFHDWYDNEHIPERIALPVFQTFTRYVAADGQKPAYANLYDLESYEATKIASAQLAQNRSAHELDVIKRIALIEPRVYEQLPGDPAIPPSPSFDPRNPAPYALLLSIDVPEEHHEDFTKWAKEEWSVHLSKLPGWVRTRNYKLKEWRRLGVEGSKDTNAPPTYLTIVDFASPEIVQTLSVLEPPHTPLYEKIEKARTSREHRFVKFLKKFER